MHYVTTVISITEFRNHADETAYLTSTAANRAALSQSLKETEERRTVEVEL